MPWVIIPNMSKGINQLLEETYSIPSEKISGMFVSEEIILFERNNFLPEEFWYPLIEDYRDYLGSDEDIDFLWDIVSEKFYDMAESVISMEMPWSMVSGSSDIAVWDFGGRFIFLGTFPDDQPPVILCAIEKKNKREVLPKVVEKMFGSEGSFFENGGDGVFGVILAPFIISDFFNKDEVKSFIKSYLEGTDSWSLQLSETEDDEGSGNYYPTLEEWLKKEEEKERNIFKDFSSSEIHELLFSSQRNWTLEMKELVLDYIVDSKFNNGPWVD